MMPSGVEMYKLPTDPLPLPPPSTLLLTRNRGGRARTKSRGMDNQENKLKRRQLFSYPREKTTHRSPSHITYLGWTCLGSMPLPLIMEIS